jgi:indole-3-glycerol phosphate synthase
VEIEEQETVSVLDEIIWDKKAEVERRKSQKTIEQLKMEIAKLPRCRNFYKAVTKPNKRGINVIAEVKKASPSAGVIRAKFDPAAIAKTYQRCGADAISVLTDEKYFQGKLEHLTQVKNAVELPVLRKDFIIDGWQVYESRAAGADAILLIADCLKLGTLSDLMILAAELSLTVLLEVYSADVLLNVRGMIGFPKKGNSVLGINNRDLNTMQVDLNTTSRLISMLDENTEVVAESGIKTKADVEKLKRAGVRAVLIGQTLCESNDIEGKFRELFG